MKVGDLAYMTKSMLEMGYSEFGIVIDVKDNYYLVAFENGNIQAFHPRWVRNDPIKRRQDGRKG